MHPKMLKAMKAKKKREVDPNAPPRPNLLSHDKVIKGMAMTAEQQANEIRFLTRKMQEMDRKLRAQTNYLDALHSRLANPKK